VTSHQGSLHISYSRQPVWQARLCQYQHNPGWAPLLGSSGRGPRAGRVGHALGRRQRGAAGGERARRGLRPARRPARGAGADRRAPVRLLRPRARGALHGLEEGGLSQLSCWTALHCVPGRFCCMTGASNNPYGARSRRSGRAALGEPWQSTAHMRTCQCESGACIVLQGTCHKAVW